MTKIKKHGPRNPKQQNNSGAQPMKGSGEEKKQDSIIVNDYRILDDPNPLEEWTMYIGGLSGKPLTKPSKSTRRTKSQDTTLNPAADSEKPIQQDTVPQSIREM